MNNSCFYKKIDLFGNETIRFYDNKTKQPNLFGMYDEFAAKFEIKKTTDDCYTPAEVFDIVLNYVKEKCNLEGKEIFRPFYPGGDYESVEYPSNAVVIDNPPFSIFSKVCRFYIERGISFFLFAPHLTLFSADIDATCVVVGADIIYENKAKVKTSFITNMIGDAKIIGVPELYSKLQSLNRKGKTHLPKYEYPQEVLTVSKIAYLVERGVSVSIDKSELHRVSQLDIQKKHNKSIFGGGFLASAIVAERLAAERLAAERLAAERLAAERLVWTLSEAEQAIVKSLG